MTPHFSISWLERLDSHPKTEDIMRIKTDATILAGSGLH